MKIDASCRRRTHLLELVLELGVLRDLLLYHDLVQFLVSSQAHVLRPQGVSLRFQLVRLLHVVAERLGDAHVLLVDGAGGLVQLTGWTRKAGGTE